MILSMNTKVNITQAQMADFLGVSQQYISLLINDKIIPRIKKIKRFSKITNTELSFWVDSTGDEKEAVIKLSMKKSKNKSALQQPNPTKEKETA
ncbi:helix-turn-helix domain-containing protein [Desulfospira joergensenii]|uniref:helix-turn-helix domain-containing protein n=1 Tax=Desulfospira joergensenii TaxID=53329 RepID=UPI0003B2EAEE|nr:helix-turn-helix transcriptional regulator [Desulfospira joergensenii]